MPKVLESEPRSSAREDAAELAHLWQASDTGDLWHDADLPAMVRYLLLGAKGLVVPRGWEWIIPTSLN